MRRLFITFAFLFVSMAHAATVTVVNYSSWDIHYLFVSSSASNNWGPDQLGNQVLGSDQQISLSVPAGKWDVRFIDEDGDECVVVGVLVHGRQDIWDISDEDLIACASATNATGSYNEPRSSTVTVINYSS